MTIRRGQRASDNFAQIANAALQDESLSYRARGVLASMLSRPPGWTTSAERIAAAGLEGRDAIKAALRELEAAGYLVRSRSRDDKGQWHHIQDVYDIPVKDAPPTE